MVDIERFIEKINALMAAYFTRRLARATGIFRAGLMRRPAADEFCTVVTDIIIIQKNMLWLCMSMLQRYVKKKFSIALNLLSFWRESSSD